MIVPMRHQNWGPAGNTGLSGGIPTTSGALQQATGQSAPMPTPYPPQNNAPQAAVASPMQPPRSAFMPPMAPNYQQRPMMQRPMPQPGALQSMQRPMQRPMQQPMQPQMQQQLMQWFQQQMPMWQRSYQNTVRQPQLQQPAGGLNLFNSRYVG